MNSQFESVVWDRIWVNGPAQIKKYTMAFEVVVLLMIFLSGSSCGIRLDGNGYRDILIAINPAVSEDPQLIERLQDMIKDGSQYLFEATQKRLYVSEVTILVPPNWSSGTYSSARTELYDKANIVIDKPNPVYGDNPYTLQYGECGSQGQYIHLTPKFMLDDKLLDHYGPRGRLFVHEWAHLRWGVYDEYNEEQPFYLSAGNIEATRCSKDIRGFIVRLSDPSLDCVKDVNGLPSADCTFVPDNYQETTASIMYHQSLHSVKDFCTKSTHNTQAPNMQNRMCGERSVEEVISSMSVDKAVSVPPLVSSPTPVFTVVQRKRRIVCLVLDVSGSMLGQRIMRQRQAASLFIQKIIEEQAYVGIVTFTGVAVIKEHLTLIQDDTSRHQLVASLPTVAGGGTDICEGLMKGLEVITVDGSTSGNEIIFLTDGESSVNCVPMVNESRAIVHTISLGPNAHEGLSVMADISGGKYFTAIDSLDSNQLVNVFASLTTSDGNLTKQTIQLESTGSKTLYMFNGSVSIDKTVGNDTSFLVLYETSPPEIFIYSPTGDVYDTSQFTNDASANSFTLDIPGTANTGVWNYTLINKQDTSQSLSMTVTSRASNEGVPPVMVKTHMNQQSSDGSRPMVVYAEVSQRGVPVILADVRATLENITGETYELQLLDNGAGADAFRHDGIYSRYFIQNMGGKYSLKVKVQNGDGKATFFLKRHSGALYIPGYVVDGTVVLNPPKPPVSEEDLQADIGSFTRTAIGESFSVEIPPGAPAPQFPPSKITDLNAVMQEDTCRVSVQLTWTAPGEDYDQGTAQAYEIRYSEDLGLLRSNFSDAHLIDTSSLRPKQSGSLEWFFFTPRNGTIRNGTTLFFVAKALDKDKLLSEASNLAQVTKFVPVPSPAVPSPTGSGVNYTIVISVTVLATVACLVAILTGWLAKKSK